MDCIEQIWKLALGDNSPLANAAKSAADELDQLRAKLAEAQAESNFWKRSSQTWASKYETLAESFQSHPNKPVIEQLEQQLAEAQAEIERLKKQRRDWLDNDKTAHALVDQEREILDLRQQLAASQATNEKLLALEPEWIVNDMGELGVKVGSRFFFLYKGENIEYTSGKHDDGVEPILYRIVGKREFGETCKPDLYYSKGYAVTGRYTENLVFHQGLSFGSPEDSAWRPLPETGAVLPNDTTALNKLLAGVYEECAVHVGRAMFRSSYVTPEQLAEELRALAKQKGLTNEQ